MATQPARDASAAPARTIPQVVVNQPASAEARSTPTAVPPATRPADDTAAAPAAPAKRSRKSLIFVGLGILALVVASYFGFRYWTVGRFFVSTDDAYIQADVTPLIAKANGYVATIQVKDNASVHAGDVLAEIDPGDYRLAVQTAQNKVDAQHATIDRIAAQILADNAAEEQAVAKLASSNATRIRAEADFARSETLTSREFGSKQTLDAARAARDSAVADVASEQAGVSQARANTEVTKAEQKEATASLAGLQTALASAERDLSFTAIKAPADGVVGNRAVNVGSYVSVGSRVMALVPADTLYVAANFKETQLTTIAVGQEVDLRVDAVGSDTIHGRIESIAPASGSVFSLLPVENATGNFTKIVQRVPVRIAISPADVETFKLRPGLSVRADVDTRTGPKNAAASVN